MRTKNTVKTYQATLINSIKLHRSNNYNKIVVYRLIDGFLSFESDVKHLEPTTRSGLVKYIS